MPATEQTWRNQRVLHIIFGVSSLVLVLATVLLLAKDHNREWKDWQLKSRAKEAWMLQARHDLMADQFAEKMSTFDEEMRIAQGEPLNAAVISEFKAAVTQDALRLDPEASEADFGDLDAAVESFGAAVEAIADAEVKVSEAAEDAKAAATESLFAAEDVAAEVRNEVLDTMAGFIVDAKQREKLLVGKRKFVAASRTSAVSTLGLMEAGGEPAEAKAKIQKEISGFSAEIVKLTEDIALAKSHRLNLSDIRGAVDARRAELFKQKSVMTTDLSRLTDQVYKNTSNFGEWMVRLPVLNALYDGNVKINQIWLPELTINYNFSTPARFDRCKTCHVSISQAAPGTPTESAYPVLSDEERNQTITLATPDEAPAEDATLRDVYGIKLADTGIVDYDAVTIFFVLPGSPAAKAGLESGDVISFAGDTPVYDQATVTKYLLTDRNEWGEESPASLTIVRGLEHPFSTHPRLDLFLSDSSPHPEKDFGCTICHDGQGSGTAFPWTSHTPDNATQQNNWRRDHAWFDNHHWIFPMKPARFAESNCLKCHHEKGGLEPSDRFPEPPAPKLVAGWTLVEEYGCFGCHETNGFNGPDQRIGPDVRLEPNYAETAQQILNDAGLNAEQRSWAERLVSQPSDAGARHQLYTAVEKDKRLASRSETSTEALLTSTTHGMAANLKDVESPGSYRKVGPSLRYLSSKVEKDWLYTWIKEPKNFRPSTKMPQFFGLHEHLQDPEDKEQLDEALKYEPVEIRAMTEFLLSNSDDFEYLKPPSEVTEEPSVVRGKWQFESRGCLACHSHEAFEGIASTQGPDLSRVASKFKTEKGALWLYSWVKQPHRYHVRTKMPELYLEPIVEKDELGKPTGKITDPAADLAVFLMSGDADWKPSDMPAGDEWSDKEIAALTDLAQEWLTSDMIPSARAKKFVQEGIPESLRAKVKSDEKLLIGITDENRAQKLKTYIARRSISKYGCFGCHDIPGFEDAKPIGAALAEWGRKDSSKLAFENIHKFLEGHGNPNYDPSADHSHDDEHAGHGHLDPADFDDDTSYYLQSLNSHSRDGFIWQKLRMPRSYDYKTTRNKGYNERLRMPKFPFDKDQREAVITFVLGLVNEAPSEKYVFKPNVRQNAIIEGRQVLERFNCAGCHTLKMEEWQVAFEEGSFDSPSEVADFPFLAKHFSQKAIAESLAVDNKGMLHTTLLGHPILSQETGLPQRVDEDGLEIEEDDDESEPYYLFKLWDDTLIEGQPWLIGIQDVMVPADADGYGPASGEAFPAWGGDLARYLYPKAIAHIKETNPQVKGSEAWGWLPPPLMAEGEKVQNDWLHSFLMDPIEIRPAAVMRMPNFHMSSAEAAKLVDYFAASSNAEFPYEYKTRQSPSYLAAHEAAYEGRLNDAMNIVVDGNYCVKCHAVGDFNPDGDPLTFGPDLAEVHKRLRPGYLHKWVANPKRILPYTGMPVNIPYKADADHLGGIAQSLFHGTSVQQLDGLVDLLVNFDIYAKRQTSVTPMVEAAAAAAKGESTSSDAAPEEDSN